MSQSISGDRGAVGRLSPEHARDGASLVRTGRVYSLAVETSSEGPAWPGRTYQVVTGPIYLHDKLTHGQNKLEGFDDYVSIWCGVGTHIDGFGHVAIDGLHYGDLPTSEVLRSRGAAHHGIETVPPVVTRGVLLDVAASRGVAALEAGYEITPDDIDSTAERQGVQIRPGDVVLIHTATLRDVTNKGEFEDKEPGIGPAGARHLVDDLGVVAIGCDNWALEVIPAPDPADFLPVHGYLLRERGVHIMENVWTRDLASDGVYEFLFVVAAPKLVGALQAPIHPVAVA
jgi:kynurenine formamidase